MLTLMRYLILTVLCFTALSAAEIFHARVSLPEGGDLTGWWDPDAKVMYQAGNKFTWVQEPKSVQAIAAATNDERPPRHIFKRLPDLPYGRVMVGERTYEGWYHEASGVVYPIDPKAVIPFHGANVAHMDQLMSAPTAMPAQARNDLDHWAIAHAAELDAKAKTP